MSFGISSIVGLEYDQQKLLSYNLSPEYNQSHPRVAHQDRLKEIQKLIQDQFAEIAALLKRLI